MKDSAVLGAVGGVERRISPRYSCDIDIAIEWGATVLQGAVKDISPGGMFIALQSPLWVGARFAAQLSLEKPVTVDCVVRRVEPRRGMGATFLALHDSGQAAVKSALERLASA